jgi:hypothetical protein
MHDASIVQPSIAVISVGVVLQRIPRFEIGMLPTPSSLPLSQQMPQFKEL